MTEFFTLFTKYNPDFISKLDLFPAELKNKLLNKLKDASTESKFLSLVTEINFGLLFTELGFSLQYEQIHFDNKTPDWTISIEKQNAICEVYRIGQSELDQKITDFENKLKRGFESIKYGYRIKFSFEIEWMVSEDAEIEKIISELTIWISNNRKVGEKVTINKIIFEILAANKKNKITYISDAKLIDYKIHRLVQREYFKSNNRVTEKLINYSDNISQSRIPYFVCIESDFKNGFDFDEFISYFQCSYCVYSEDDILNNCENEFECFELGCLYDHPTVSGIIIKIGNDYRKILNPLKNQLIYNQDNFQLISKIDMIKNASA